MDFDREEITTQELDLALRLILGELVHKISEKHNISVDQLQTLTLQVLEEFAGIKNPEFFTGTEEIFQRILKEPAQ